jgi:hypothetical protein
MVGNTKSELQTQPGACRRRLVFFTLCLLALAGLPSASRAALQFDVFLGYDGMVPEATWFPLVCEIKNDGPAFNGVIEVGSQMSDGQSLRVPVELPTGTLKRIVIPLFSAARGYSSWDARLYDEHGRERAEQTALRPRKLLAATVPLVGALPRTVNGVPVIRPVVSQQQEMQPMVARFQSSLFPDNPIVLTGLDALYLNSERAPDLKVNQVNALLDWINAGGHLIVAVEQISDVTGTPWLRGLFPCDPKDIQPVAHHPELQSWLQSSSWATNATYNPNLAPLRYPGYSPGRQRTVPVPQPAVNSAAPFNDLPDDAAFEGAPLQVATGALRDGSVVVSAGDTPLMVTAHRGRGRVTALLFSPEREPFRSWKNLPTFWAKMTEVPGSWYLSNAFGPQSGWSSDGIFGAMIDSRQVHKLPVGWLLLLLVVYLVIIGPLDQYWLKRIGKPMLTWITFPCYVVLFSLLIYFIGYKLRAGESEWSELHLVDVLLSGDRAQLRGQTYSSVYSPANQKYTVESRQQFATLRGEFAGRFSGGAPTEKMNVLVQGDSFRGEVFVPVWTSQLLVSDWWQQAGLPLYVTVDPKGDGWEIKVDNRTERNLTSARVVIEGYVMELGEIPAKATKTFTVSKEKGIPLRRFVMNYGSTFQNAVQMRQRTFGGGESWQISDLPNSSAAASFLSQLSGSESAVRNFAQPAGLDLSSIAEHGNAILLAWAADYSPVKPLYQFSPRRGQRNTLWRVAVPLR